MILSTYQFTDRELEGYATDVKNIFVQFLNKEGYITEDQAIELINEFALVHRKPGFFRRVLRKGHKQKKGEEHNQLIIVKQCSLSKEESCGESQKTSKESATPDSSLPTSTETTTQQCDAS